MEERAKDRFHLQRRIFSLTVVLALLGCTEGGAPGPSVPYFVTRVEDTTIFTSQRPEVLDTAVMTHVSRVGRFNGPEDHLIAGVESFTVGWRGEVYVADVGVRVFSPDGEDVRWIAREGKGPGEVGTVRGMAVDRTGRLLILDRSNARITVLDTSGAILDHWRLPYGRSTTGGSALVSFPSGETLLRFSPPLHTDERWRGFPKPIFLRFDSAGALLDTIFAPARFESKCTTRDDPHFAGGFWRDKREPFFPKIKWTATRSGELVYGCPSEYEIDRVQSGGQVSRIVHRREPMVEPPEVRDAFVESLEQWARLVGRDWQWKGERPPERKPYYHQLIAGRHGRLWVWPAHLRESRPNPRDPFSRLWLDPRTGTFDVFDRDGRFLGPVLLPEGARFQWFSGWGEPFVAGDTVWLVRRDSLDVEYVDRLLVEW